LANEKEESTKHESSGGKQTKEKSPLVRGIKMVNPFRKGKPAESKF